MTTPPRVVWRLWVECPNCGQSFDVEPENVIFGEAVVKNTRVYAAWLPDGCPKCQNLRLVAGGVLARCKIEGDGGG